jgi:hypothetical protein
MYFCRIVRRRRGMRGIAPSPAAAIKAVISAPTQHVDFTQNCTMPREWKIHAVWLILEACAAMT